MPIKFKIVTPERTVYEAEIDQITLPTMDGEITILPHHVPLIAALKSGEMLLKKDGELHPLAVSGGLVEVREGSEVVVLADTAERAVEIDIKRAEEAKERAQKLMIEKQLDAEQYAYLAAKMEKELARLKVVRKHRSHHISGSAAANERG